MLRTSLRICWGYDYVNYDQFLSSNAQDFIEDTIFTISLPATRQFLSSNAQDFIEE